MRMLGFATLLILFWANAALAVEVACRSVDDTVAVQTAIDTAKGSRGVVTLPVGTCAVRTLDLTGSSGMTLRGQGRNVTHVRPIQDAVPALIDLTDAYFVTLQDFTLGQGPDGSYLAPYVGILMAFGPQAVTNVNTIERVFVSGYWRLAALGIYGACCSSVRDSQFWNYWPAYTVAILGDQALGPDFRSAHLPLGAPPGSVPMWTFSAVEIHSTTPVPALYLRWTNAFTFVGGGVFGPGCLILQSQTPQVNLTLLGLLYSSDTTGPTSVMC